MIENKWINCFFFQEKYALRKFRSIDLIGAKFCCFFFLVKQKKNIFEFRPSPPSNSDRRKNVFPVSSFTLTFSKFFFLFSFFFCKFYFAFLSQRGGSQSWALREEEGVEDPLSLFRCRNFLFCKRGFFFNSFFFPQKSLCQKTQKSPVCPCGNSSWGTLQERKQETELKRERERERERWRNHFSVLSDRFRNSFLSPSDFVFFFLSIILVDSFFYFLYHDSTVFRALIIEIHFQIHNFYSCFALQYLYVSFIYFFLVLLSHPWKMK